jgi:glyoxylase-like metal-dependent hydrolase (beta-lactamase superfamily II)
MARSVVPGVFRIGSAGTNAFLLAADELVLIDTLLPKRLPRLLKAVGQAGRSPRDVRHIAITHYHVDHVGSLAAAEEATGGTASVPQGDAGLVRRGGRPKIRPIGIGKVVLPIFYSIVPKSFDAARVDREIGDGDEIGSTGLRAIFTPGHTRGHVSYLWPEHGGVLFVGDAAAHDRVGLDFGYSCEDMEAAKSSLQKLAKLDFEVALFGHGRTIKANAAAAFRKAAERLAA